MKNLEWIKIKTSFKILSVLLVVVLGSVIFFSFYVGLGIFNPIALFYIPSILEQIIFPQGNGIICFDACGPCSAWGYNYVLVDKQCRIPDKVEDCYFVSPQMEWKFFNDKCILNEEYREKYEN